MKLLYPLIIALLLSLLVWSWLKIDRLEDKIDHHLNQDYEEWIFEGFQNRRKLP